jgi:hypothetical protein
MDVSKWPWKKWFLSTATTTVAASRVVMACGSSNACNYVDCPSDQDCYAPPQNGFDGPASFGGPDGSPLMESGIDQEDGGGPDVTADAPLDALDDSSPDATDDASD